MKTYLVCFLLLVGSVIPFFIAYKLEKKVWDFHDTSFFAFMRPLLFVVCVAAGLAMSVFGIFGLMLQTVILLNSL